MQGLEKRREELEAYIPVCTKKNDFDLFWKVTLEQGRQMPLNPEMKKIDYPSPYVEVYEISYCGFDETRIHGWYLVPVFANKAKYPCMIQYHGFMDSRGFPWQVMQWVMMGMAIVTIDCREQGGTTGNCAHYSGVGQVMNVVSKGVLDKNEYYYRAVYVDCIKAIDFAMTCRAVDDKRIVIRGTSQGGALGMAVCSLDDRPVLGIVNVPSNSDIEARVIGKHGSFEAVHDYLKCNPDKTSQVFETLSYFDTMNMADKIKCPIFASVALEDNICPAQCYYASYNRITSPKKIAIYPFNGHDGAGIYHMERELQYVKESGIVL